VASILDLLGKEEPEEDYGVEVDIDGFCEICARTARQIFYHKEKKVLTTICSKDHVVSTDAPDLEWLLHG